MTMRFPFRLLLILTVPGVWLATGVAPAANAQAQAQAASRSTPEQGMLSFRDVRVFGRSSPDLSDPRRIHVELTWVNRTDAAVQVSGVVEPHAALGFAGGSYEVTAPARGSGSWRFELAAPDRLGREVMRGLVEIAGHEERLLFIAVRGPDPIDYDMMATKTLRIDAAAQVVAVHTERTAETVERMLQAQRDRHAATPRVNIADAQGAWTIAHRINGEPDADLRQAIDDLVRCVRLQTGADMSVTALAAEATGVPDDQRGTLLLELDPDGEAGWPHREASVVTFPSESICRIVSPTQAGLRHALYTLLHDDLGARWFFPGELGEEIPVPDDRTARLTTNRRELTPSFFSSRGASWGAEPLWDRRNRAFIDGRMGYGHAWHGYVNKGAYPYDEFPEYYARDREGKIRVFDSGWSHTNFCSTHPEVIEIVARKVNERLSQPGALVASLDPNDYAPMCLCDRCVALDKQYGVETGDGQYATDRLLHFSKEIHDRLDEANRDKYLGILVYAFQIELPTSAKPHPWHTGMLCNQPWTFDHTRPFNDPTSLLNPRFHRLVQGWGDLLTQMGYYDYYGHWHYFGPWAMVHKMREDLPAFHEAGGTYLFLETQPNFAAQGLNMYAAARLTWDINADMDVLLHDLFQTYYGPAAGAMRAFWLATERHYALSRSGADVHQRVGRRAAMWDELDAYLGAALDAVADAPPRFAERVRVHQLAFEYGRERFLVDGVLNVRLHSPASVDRRNLDVPSLHQLRDGIHERRARLEAIQAQFNEHEGQWPRLMPNYFRAAFDPMLASIEARLERLTREANADEQQAD